MRLGASFFPITAGVFGHQYACLGTHRVGLAPGNGPGTRSGWLGSHDSAGVPSHSHIQELSRMVHLASGMLANG